MEDAFPSHRINGIFTYIYLHEWLILRVNVGVYIYIPYMDPMGFSKGVIFRFLFRRGEIDRGNS